MVNDKLLLQDVSKLLGTNTVFLQHISVCSVQDPTEDQ